MLSAVAGCMLRRWMTAMRDMAMGWLAAVALPCACEQTPCPALQVRDIELLRILAAVCLSG